MDKDLFAPGGAPGGAAPARGSARRPRTAEAEAPALSFEQAYTRLEEIVNEMERGSSGLERLLELFEEGVGLTRLCSDYLKQAQLRVERFIEQRDGQWVLKELEPPGAL